MATAEYLKVFRTFIEASPHFGHIGAMEQEFYLGSDRSAVILQAANVENSLETLLLAKMRQPLSNDLRDRIFDGNGSLSSFSDKILVGFALEMYGPTFRHDLDIIRELRNGFAHVRLPLTLTAPEVAGMCAHLQLPDHKELRWLPQAYSEKYDLEIAADDKHPRTRFTRACHTISLCFIELAGFWLEQSGGVQRILP